MFFILGNKNLEKRKIEEIKKKKIEENNKKEEENRRKIEEYNRRKIEEYNRRKIEEYNRNGIIFNLSEAKSAVLEQKLDICVVSYGGCCSNQLVDVLSKNNYICRTPVWDTILCHCPYYIDLGIPIIYIYDDPRKSFLSMKNRDSTLAATNQRKLSNNLNVEISDENLLQLMFAQFLSFKNSGSVNVLLIQSKEIFQDSIVSKLREFLRNPSLDFFPIQYKTPKTNVNDVINDCYESLFQKYDAQIKTVNNHI
jgi:hypothetical protein